MRAMLLGATGFIGPSVMRRLTARDCEVVAVSRTASAGSEASKSVHILADRSDAMTIARSTIFLRAPGSRDDALSTFTLLSELMNQLLFFSTAKQ
jgi:uncharacterized protein YbjT (DUF2867 family)